MTIPDTLNRSPSAFLAQEATSLNRQVAVTTNQMLDSLEVVGMETPAASTAGNRPSAASTDENSRLQFHENHGRNVRLCNTNDTGHKIVAKRTDSYNQGKICFWTVSRRPFEHYFYLKDKFSTKNFFNFLNLDCRLKHPFVTFISSFFQNMKIFLAFLVFNFYLWVKSGAV